MNKLESPIEPATPKTEVLENGEEIDRRVSNEDVQALMWAYIMEEWEPAKICCARIRNKIRELINCTEVYFPEQWRKEDKPSDEPIIERYWDENARRYQYCEKKKKNDRETWDKVKSKVYDGKSRRKAWEYGIRAVTKFMGDGQTVFVMVDGKVISTCSFQKENRLYKARPLYKIRLGASLKLYEGLKYYSKARKAVIKKILERDPNAMIYTTTKNKTLITNYRRKPEWKSVSPEELGLKDDGKYQHFLFDPLEEKL